MLHVKKGTQQIKNTAAKKKEITLAGITFKRANDLRNGKKCNLIGNPNRIYVRWY